MSDGDKAMSGSLHFDNPPPYDKTLGGGRRYDDADVNRFSPCSEETPMILKYERVMRSFKLLTVQCVHDCRRL